MATRIAAPLAQQSMAWDRPANGSRHALGRSPAGPSQAVPLSKPQGRLSLSRLPLHPGRRETVASGLLRGSSSRMVEMRVGLGIVMILTGLLLGFVALDWSSTPSTECGNKFATVDDTDELAPAARTLEVAVVQLAEVLMAPAVRMVTGDYDLACRWTPRSLFALYAFLCLGWEMRLPLSRP
jgi:hypothetical protein